MEPARNFTDLVMWQKAQKLEVYIYPSKFPREEIYALTSQFRRAAVSIAQIWQKGLRKNLIKIKCDFIIFHKDQLKNVVII